MKLISVLCMVLCLPACLSMQQQPGTYPIAVQQPSPTTQQGVSYAQVPTNTAQQNTMYPQQNTMYPQQNTMYPQQQQMYPQQQQMYPQQQQMFSQQQQMYPQQPQYQNNYMPNNYVQQFHPYGQNPYSPQYFPQQPQQRFGGPLNYWSNQAQQRGFQNQWGYNPPQQTQQRTQQRGGMDNMALAFMGDMGRDIMLARSGYFPAVIENPELMLFTGGAFGNTFGRTQQQQQQPQQYATQPQRQQQTGFGAMDPFSMAFLMGA